ncbi:MAG: hypothetical protein ACXVBW_13470, partial [Bdellovibrionota bacterium]
SETPSWSAHSLLWPIQFQDKAHSLGNAMAEFQSYGDGPYYHGGLDLRVAAAAAVHTPIAGRIEAGHYGYTNNPDGSSTKFWNAYPQGGDTTYFEIAVITDDGYRFEFHHMDETRIAAPILKILKSGQSGRVSAGALLGNTIPWPGGDYHHTHYNILTPAGTHLNPEFYSPLIDDHEKPAVSAVLASFAGGKTAEFGTGMFGDAPEFFAVAVIDHQDSNVYDHPPALASIEFANGKKFAWDFRERLSGADGKFPPIWDFFVETISGPDGKAFSTEGGYGEGVSVIRIPVPADAHGQFTIRIADQAGNATELQGHVR